MTLFFAETMGVSLSEGNTFLTVNPADYSLADLPDSSKKWVGIQVSAGKSDKSYPSDLIIKLIEKLIENSYQVFLLGDSWDGPPLSGEKDLWNMIGKTPTIIDFAAMLSKMDHIICPDSVSAHIGGVLGIPTLVLFSVTSSENFSHFPSVFCLTSRAECSPCYALNHCPIGKHDCTAMEDHSMKPEVLLSWVRSL